MTTPLTKHHCVPCEGGTKPLTRAEFEVYLPQVSDWNVTEHDHALAKEFTFKNFAEALAFINKVGGIAESEGHHPDINLHDWKYVSIYLTTHAIKGLSINDFVLASKIDLLLK